MRCVRLIVTACRRLRREVTAVNDVIPASALFRLACPVRLEQPYRR